MATLRPGCGPRGRITIGKPSRQQPGAVAARPRIAPSFTKRRPQPFAARATAAVPTTLTEPEAAARAAFLASAAAAAPSSSTNPGAAAVTLLRRAGATRDADADAVLGALAHALTADTPLPGAAPATAAALVGKPWRLVFSAPAPLQAWRYIPVPEFFSLPPPAGALPAGPVCLSSDVGPLHFAFTGAGRFVSGGDGSDDAVLEFAFTRADVSWGADARGPFFTRPLGDGKAKKPPKTYTFFAYLPREGPGGVEVVGTRSSGGALSLLAR